MSRSKTKTTRREELLDDDNRIRHNREKNRMFKNKINILTKTPWQTGGWSGFMHPLESQNS